MKCPICGFNGKLSTEEKGKRIRSGMARSTKRIGAPKKHDPATIFRLLELGNTHSQIADKLGCSRATVSRAIRKMKPTDSIASEGT